MPWGQAAGIFLDPMQEYDENIRKDILLHVPFARATVHIRTHMAYAHKTDVRSWNGSTRLLRKPNGSY